MGLRIFPKLIKDLQLGKQWGVLIENGNSRVRLELDSSHSQSGIPPVSLDKLWYLLRTSFSSVK